MYGISRIQQIIKPVSGGRFQQLVTRNQADKYSKGFSCYHLLVGMIYAQLSGSQSLRILEQRFNSHRNQHYHLNARTLHRSTLAEALNKKSDKPFSQMLGKLMQQCSRKLRQQTGELLYLLDSTPIMLGGRGFDDWVVKGGHIKGIKMHILMDAQTHCPVEQSFSAANINDIDEGRLIQLKKGATYVFDKGYYDYNWWHQIHTAGAYFVTRLKSNAAVKAGAGNPIQDSSEIEADETVYFKYRQNRGGGRINAYHNRPLRRILVKRPGKAALVLVTNNMEASAEAVAEHYKSRWQIELLFKWLKQHLKIKRFLGTGENAVKIQLLCALITYLLLQLYKQTVNHPLDLHLLFAEISSALFERPETLYAHYRRRERERLEWAGLQGVLFEG